MGRMTWLLVDGQKVAAEWDGEKWVPLDEVPQVVESADEPEEIAED